MSVAAIERQPGFAAERHGRFARAVAVWVAATGAAIMAWVAASAGAKGAILVVGAVSFAAVLMLVSKREEVILATAVVSIIALFRKSLGTQFLDVSGGPVSIYVSSFDVMVGVLWFTWFVREPYEMWSKLRSAFRRPIMWAPLIGLVLLLPSFITAPETGLALAELVRMVAVYAVFVYFAVRIRTREHVLIVLGALGALVCLEALIVAGQYVTRGPLGMSLFGTPEKLNDRFDGYNLLRPFGTMLHPVFLGAFMGPCSLVALSLAINLRNTRLRLLALAIAIIAAVPILLADARSAAMGFAVGAVVLIVWSMVTGRLTARVVGVAVTCVLLVLVFAFPYVSSTLARSLRSDGNVATRTATCTRAIDAATACPSHFSFEWRARWQLNTVGVREWEDKPIAGQGLNNFEQVMQRFDPYGLIFADAPVHNLYLLYMAESGVLGLLAVLAIGIPFLVMVVRLSRSTHRLYSAIGFGVCAAYVFWVFEELVEFSLRQEQPRVLFFMLSGIAVACTRMSGLDRPRPILRTAPLAVSPMPNGDRVAPAVAGGASHRVGRREARMRRRRRTLSMRTSRVEARSRRARRRRPHRPAYRTRAQRLARKRAIRRRRNALIATTLLAGSSMALAGASPPLSDPSLAGLRIVFSAVDRDTHLRGIYTVDANGDNLRKVSPDDGRNYSWPTWAYNGTQIAFTARAGGTGAAEPVYLMNADGSGVRPITNNPWRNGQPHVMADGRSMIFTSFWSEYREVATYRMSFDTGLVTNLSAADSHAGAFDSDPDITTDGRLVFIDSREPNLGENRPGQVAIMNSDGGDRRLLTDDGRYNTDPSMSPDGSTVAIARYVGEGAPADPNAEDRFQTKLQDFVLIARDLATGTEFQLTQGQPCFMRAPGSECTPDQSPSYTPEWTPDGAAIGYVGILSRERTCICVVNRDGSNPRTLITSDSLAINWFDWVVPGAPPPGAILDPAPAGSLSERRMLVSAVDRQGNPVTLLTTPDRWGGQPLPVPGVLNGADARLAPDRKSIWFEGNAPFDPARVDYGPPPPAGTGRTRHYTLGWMQQYYTDPPLARELSPLRQVWSLDLDALRLQRLTTAGTEDFRDAIPDGEARGNVDPSVSPDGRYVTFTSVSSVNTESFILRYDRRTGEILSLTNATAGAVAVSDAEPAWSPDGKQVAFAANTLDGMQIWVMDADGYHARKLTDDEHVNISPSWSPDGRFVVYSSYRGSQLLTPGSEDLPITASKGGIDLTNWVLVRVDVATGQQTVLSADSSSVAFKPVYDPDGTKIYYISISGPPRQPDVYVIDAGGGVGRPLQVTMNTFETAVDIR
jgi:Tol biopolymer transport system component/O-antigen ligase